MRNKCVLFESPIFRPGRMLVLLFLLTAITTGNSAEQIIRIPSQAKVLYPGEEIILPLRAEIPAGLLGEYRFTGVERSCGCTEIKEIPMSIHANMAFSCIANLKGDLESIEKTIRFRANYQKEEEIIRLTCEMPVKVASFLHQESPLRTITIPITAPSADQSSTKIVFNRVPEQTDRWDRVSIRLPDDQGWNFDLDDAGEKLAVSVRFKRGNYFGKCLTPIIFDFFKNGIRLDYRQSFWVHADISGPVKASPSVLALGAVQVGHDVLVSLHLDAVNDSSIRIESIHTSQSGIIDVRVIGTEKPGSSLAIGIHASSPGRFSGWIDVVLSHPSNSTIRIPVSFTAFST